MPAPTATLATRVIAGSQLIKTPDGFAIKVVNPLNANYLDLPPGGTRLNGADGKPAPDGEYVLSVDENNAFSVRPVTGIGNFETCVKQGMFLVYRCWGVSDAHRFPIPFCE